MLSQPKVQLWGQLQIFRMAVFGLRTQENETVNRFVNLTRERINSDNLIFSPFVGTINKIDNLLIVYIEPIYYNFTWLPLVAALFIFIYKGLTYWLLPFLLIGCCTFFWSWPFYYLLFKAGLRKEGYKGKIKLVRLTKQQKREVLNGAE